MPRSVVCGRRIGSARPASCLSRNVQQRLRLGRVVAVDVDDHAEPLGGAGFQAGRASIDNKERRRARVRPAAEPRPAALPFPRSRSAQAMEAVTIPVLQKMKREGKKSVGVVAWDFQTAQIADRAGVDFIVSRRLGRRQPLGPRQPARGDARRDPDLLQGGAARHAARALVICDIPFGPLQEGLAHVARGRGAARQGRRRRHGEARRAPPNSRRPSPRSPAPASRSSRSSA